MKELQPWLQTACLTEVSRSYTPAPPLRARTRARPTCTPADTLTPMPYSAH